VEPKKYIIAPRRGGANPPPADWQQRLASIAGVKILGSTAYQAQFLADEPTTAKVRSELGEFCHIEEGAERGKLFT
jgi:hypothetical protein